MNWKEYISNNPKILSSEGKLRAVLNDEFWDEQLKINLLIDAYKLGVIAEVKRNYPINDTQISILANRMVKDFGVEQKNAAWAIKSWTELLSKKVLDDLEKTEKEDNQKEKEESEKRLKEEQEKSAKEKERLRLLEARAKEDFFLKAKSDYQKKYENTSFQEDPDSVYVPCGFGYGDKGFLIYGIKKEERCKLKEATVFALIYNYLTRNSHMTEKDIPKYLQKKQTAFALDYQAIYRLAIILLQLIRHNCTKGGILYVEYTEDEENLNYAVDLINDYSERFCRIIGTNPIRIRVLNKNGGIPLSLEKKEGVYIQENTSNESNAREIWYGNKINYRLTEENRKDLEYLLSEISDFSGFKFGQYEALCDMLNSKGNSICIMPTGSGKSLIFYLASLLQPLPIFVISPTDILIQDQIRNLELFHHIDNVSHMVLTEENSFSNWEICNSINYLTPETFQNRNLLVKFRYINNGTKLIGYRETKIAPGARVSYVVLDEIHCLSNWGHDFRPEYLMLSKYLNSFLDNINMWGFTGTANLTIVEDIQKQLDIKEDNIFSPVEYDKFNVKYDFRKLETEKEMLQEVANITESLIKRRERTLIFTKNDETSKKVAEAVGIEADIFVKENPKAYYHFAAGESLILVSCEDLGIGINLPNVKNIIHFGLPLSKNEYVQEIGRAGRADEEVKSYVLYLNDNEQNVPEGLLKRNNQIDNLKTNLLENDYTEVYKKIRNGVESESELYNDLINFKKKDFLGFKKYNVEELDKIKKYLYVYFLIGYIKDWYTYAADENGKNVEICVVSESINLNHLKQKLHSYFVQMANDRESIAKIDRAETEEEIIKVYVEWYYRKYLYHHKEQFLDFYDFIVNNNDSESDKIKDEIKAYYKLPFAKLISEEELYKKLTLQEIINRSVAGINRETVMNLERLNSNRYSYKIDLALLYAQMKLNSKFDEARLERILSFSTTEETKYIGIGLSKLFGSCKNSTKIELIKYIKTNGEKIKVEFNSFLDEVYMNNPKDEIYYGLIALKLNKKFNEMRENCHV